MLKQIQGALENVWLAARSEKKLKKNQITETEVREAVRRIIGDGGELTLQVQAKLLVGIVRIYAKKMKYLSDDCNEAMKSSFSLDKKLDLAPTSKKRSTPHANLQDQASLDAIFDLPELSMSEIHAKLEEESNLQENRGDVHQAKPEDLVMDKYLLEEPIGDGLSNSMQDDGFDLVDNNLVVETILNTLSDSTDDIFAGVDLQDLLSSVTEIQKPKPVQEEEPEEMMMEEEPKPVAEEQVQPEEEEQDVEMGEEDVDVGLGLGMEIEEQIEPVENLEEYLPEEPVDEEPALPEEQQQPQQIAAVDAEDYVQPQPVVHDGSSNFDEPLMLQDMQLMDENNYGEVKAEVEVPEQPEQLIEPEPVHHQPEEDYGDQSDLYQPPVEESYAPEYDQKPPVVQSSRPKPSYMQEEYVEDDDFKDAGELGLAKDDEDWFENDNDRNARYQREYFDDQEVSDFEPETVHRKPARRKKPAKRKRKKIRRKKNFRDAVSELTSEWIRDSITNTTDIIYHSRPSAVLTKRPNKLHDRTKETMNHLLETPFGHGWAPQLLDMFREKVWIKAPSWYLYMDNEIEANVDTEDDEEAHDGYHDMDMGEYEYSDLDEPPRKRARYERRYHDEEVLQDPIDPIDHINHHIDPIDHHPQQQQQQHSMDPVEPMEPPMEMEPSEQMEPPMQPMENMPSMGPMQALEAPMVDPPEPVESMEPMEPLDRNEESMEDHEDREAHIPMPPEEEEGEQAAEEIQEEEEMPEEIPEEIEQEEQAEEAQEMEEGYTLAETTPEGFTQKTVQTLQFLASQPENDLSFNTLTEDQSCKVAAGLFYELLVIRSRGLVELKQLKAYEDTIITKCETFENFFQQQF